MNHSHRNAVNLHIIEAIRCPQDTEIHYVSSALEIVKRTYNSQFREGDLLKDCEQYISGTTANVCDRLIQENSDDFKKVQKKVGALTKKGKSFALCINCYYQFAELSQDGSHYKCLWCGEERQKATCTVDTCKKEFWAKVGAPMERCSGYHFDDAHTLGSKLEGIGSGLEPLGSLASQLERLANYPNVILSDSFSRLNESTLINAQSALANAFSPWTKMSRLTNPKGPSNDQIESQSPVGEVKDGKE